MSVFLPSKKRMKKKLVSVFVCILSFVLLLGIISPKVYAVDYLDLEYYVKNKKDDSYPTNNGKWTFDYVGTVYKADVITKSEKTTYSKTSTQATVFEVMELLMRLQNIDETGNPQYTMLKDKTYQSLDIVLKSVPTYLKNTTLTKAAFCRYLNVYLSSADIVYLNSVELSDIADVSEKTLFSNDIVMVLRYGLLELDANGKFNPNTKLTYGDLMKAISRIINPYYRVTTKLYTGDKVEIQSDSFPMYYRNYDEGLFIEITKEREYGTDYYIAHITMADSCHFKTIYSNLEFSNYGMEINYMDEKISPIFIVNGDFRSPYIVRDKDLGIVRNCKIVRDKKFSNVLGMTKEGNLVAINETTAQAVIDLGIRETWTFGPWLVKDGKAVSGLDNKTHHPRTFIGQVYRDDGMFEYYLVVAEGRSSNDAGLTNYEMAEILVNCGVDIGYNLDGGGSSVMMFDGKLLSRPSSGFFRADIDYIYIK